MLTNYDIHHTYIAAHSMAAWCPESRTSEQRQEQIIQGSASPWALECARQTIQNMPAVDFSKPSSAPGMNYQQGGSGQPYPVVERSDSEPGIWSLLVPFLLLGLTL